MFVPDAPETDDKQTESLRSNRSRYWFYRFSYGVPRIDADLVPWFPSLVGKRWIITDSTQSRGSVSVNSVVLEHVNGDEKQAMAYALRVGSFVTPSFSLAKILQIPAKLRGENLFEIVVLTTPCRSDCAQVAKRTAEDLVRIISLNVP